MTSKTDSSRAPSAAAARHFERHVRRRKRALGAHDPLLDRRLGHEERARDFVGGETAEQAQRQRDARFGREHGMTRGEDQAQQVVAEFIVERFGERILGIQLALVHFPPEMLVLRVLHLAPANMIDRADASRWP
jgi:hypothetical protein